MTLTYKKSGVDIKKADSFIEAIKKLTPKKGKSVIGGFSGLFNLNIKGLKNPYLAASCDGVGTKLKLAQWLGEHRTVGVDLVAMNANDLVASGARPLFFLDYIASSSLKVSDLKELVKGIIAGCRESGCILLGGETAQMPDFYQKDDYDVAGFCVGLVDKSKIIDGSSIKDNDILIGLASNGLHSNGYSLVRKLFSKLYLTRHKKLFYRPTKIYVKPILKLAAEIKIKGIAHITGGGFYDNIARILPADISCVIDRSTWPKTKVFKLIKEKSALADKKLYHTFNMGIGLVLAVNKKDAAKAIKLLRKEKISSYVIGECIKPQRQKKERVIII